MEIEMMYPKCQISIATMSSENQSSAIILPQVDVLIEANIRKHHLVLEVNVIIIAAVSLMLCNVF